MLKIRKVVDVSDPHTLVRVLCGLDVHAGPLYVTHERFKYRVLLMSVAGQDEATVCLSGRFEVVW